MPKKPREKPRPNLEPGEVYVNPREDDNFDILWLDPAGGRIRHIRRRGERAAREWAERKRAELRGESTLEEEIPFADTVLGHDGTAGNDWLALLWHGATAVGMNPANVGLQKALGRIATAANAARKFIAPPDIGEGDVGDEEFLVQLAEQVGPILKRMSALQVEQIVGLMLERAGVKSPEAPGVVLEVLKGGKA